MKFDEFLKESAEEIDAAIEAFFVTWDKEIAQSAPRISPLVSALREASGDGKRIRGSLVLLGYSLSGRDTVSHRETDLMQIAVAYELFQTAILAHDDIIDKSPTRRGKPALHMRLGGDHYGMSQSICLGDMGFFLAFRIIAASNFPDAEKNNALQFFSQAMLATGVGESLDVALSQKNIEAKEKEVLEVYRLKTAYYTFVGPLTLGAMLGDVEDAASIRDYGENVGIAFQIQDDIRDVFGTIASLKKEIGGDIKEGKNTVLFLKAKENADKEQRDLLEKYYGNPAIGKNEIEQVKKVFVETGAFEYTQKLAMEHSKKAGKSIEKITPDSHAQHMLRAVIEYVIQ